MVNETLCFLTFLFSFVPGPPVLAQLSAEDSVRSIHQRYVTAWLNGDEAGVMDLFQSDATIVPSGMAPIKGSPAIRDFWFPKDTSTTTIHEFTSEILSLTVDDSVAHTSQKTYLSWSYEKGALHLSKDQWGYAMTVYRRQADGQWKVWRQLWTDVRSVTK